MAHSGGMVQVAGCFCEYRGRVLLLLRAPHTVQGGRWCVPGGKLELGESPLEAAIREAWEEVGIALDPLELISMGAISFPRYTFHMYRIQLEQTPKIELHLAEHTDYKWVVPQEARKLPLIEGGSLVFDQYLSSSR